MELIRRKLSGNANAMTITLLTNSEGKKMGKTEKGAVWLDAEKTSPYEFYQYWRNVGDDDVIKCMKLLTFIPMDQIREYEKLEGAQINEVKKRLAYEVTKLVHGEEAAEKARASAEAIFAGTGEGSMPEFKLDATDMGILDVLVNTKLCPSKSEARRLCQQGVVAVDDEKITDPNYTIPAEKAEIWCELGTAE